jgi:hypothetical protein
MAKTGGAVAKLEEKSKRNAVRFKLGTIKPMISRTKAPFHEKLVAYDAHRKLIANGINPAPVFEGTGLPDEVVKVPKTNAERAEADKRAPLKDEMVAGWKPRPFGKRWASGCYLAK